MRTPDPQRTTRILREGERTRVLRRKVALRVLEGADRGQVITSADLRLTVGAAEQNDLTLHDAAVSRHHLRVEIVPEGFLLTDLGSTNGTTVGNLRLRQVLAQDVVDLRLGETLLKVQPLAEEEEVQLVEDDHFGAVLGRSPVMRELFGKLAAISPRDLTVLIEGDTGTGKELIAQEIHGHSPRRDGPFIVVDCGAIPPSLIESELFGHARGAFTGATEHRGGAFEAADGGTVFLDEIGELDLSMQPRLLRVLEQRQVKRLGEARYRPIDVRVVAATNRDLQRGINEGTFRSDLFYRLAVAHLRVPPLRERPEDIELLARRFLPDVAARVGAQPKPLSTETIQEMVGYPWPGNVRELRNFLERFVTLTSGAVLDAPAHGVRLPSAPQLSVDELCTMPFREAKNAWIASFDVAYLSRQLERCDHNVAEAARRSEIDRAHLFRLIKKYGITR